LGPDPLNCSSARGGASRKYGGEADRGAARTVPDAYYVFFGTQHGVVV
jgi:hypothetical protein